MFVQFFKKILFRSMYLDWSKYYTCLILAMKWPYELTYAFIDSVTVPIWLTLSRRQLQAFSSTALQMRFGFVTVKSSPTTWMSVLLVKLVQATQSS